VPANRLTQLGIEALPGSCVAVWLAVWRPRAWRVTVRGAR
jgi:hypothetical protein